MIEQVLKYLKRMFNKPVPDPQTPTLADPQYQQIQQMDETGSTAPPTADPAPPKDGGFWEIPETGTSEESVSESPLKIDNPWGGYGGGSSVPDPPSRPPSQYQLDKGDRQARVEDRSADEDAVRHMKLGKWMTDEQAARVEDLRERFRDDNQLVDASHTRNQETQDWQRAMWGKQLDLDTRLAADIANLYRRMEWITFHFESQIDSLSDTNV